MMDNSSGLVISYKNQDVQSWDLILDMTSSSHSFKKIRITILLIILFFVGMSNWLTRLRSTDWNNSLWVVIYPINGDGSDRTQQYINTLEASSFDGIELFFQSEAHRYRIPTNDPVTVRLSGQVTSLPPRRPESGNILSIMLWSLQLRYWSWVQDNFTGPAADVQIFVMYFDPETHTRLAHSLGLQKGMVGVVYAFASKASAAQNNIVITHEFLHTLGATDKYDLTTSQPVYPDGYFEPERTPLYPQTIAEIMAGRIPISRNEATIPKSIRFSRIGASTAQEINWTN